MANQFTGSGWRFPLLPDETGGLAYTSGDENVEQSLKVLLLTDLGERVMRPDFGCGIHDLVFSTISRATLGLFESRVREAIIKWEARVEIVRLDISAQDAANGRLEIQLTCRVRDTNNEFNLVFPFYLTEGANV